MQPVKLTEQWENDTENPGCFICNAIILLIIPRWLPYSLSNKTCAQRENRARERNQNLLVITLSWRYIFRVVFLWIAISNIQIFKYFVCSTAYTRQTLLCLAVQILYNIIPTIKSRYTLRQISISFNFDTYFCLIPACRLTAECISQILPEDLKLSS